MVLFVTGVTDGLSSNEFQSCLIIQKGKERKESEVKGEKGRGTAKRKGKGKKDKNDTVINEAKVRISALKHSGQWKANTRQAWIV